MEPEQLEPCIQDGGRRFFADIGDEAAELDWGHAPRVNVSVKPSALYSQADPADFEGSVTGILARLKPVHRKVIELGGYLCVDMEMRRLKNITLGAFRRLRSDPEFRNYPHPGLAVPVCTFARRTATSEPS